MSYADRIVIDARESGTGTGRYVDKLIEHLHKLRPPYEIVLLAKPHRLHYLHDIAPHFETVETRVAEFGFGEQTKLLRQLKGLRADLVHFPMVQQPILYRGKVVTTMQDLTTIRFRNPTKSWLVFTVKREVYKWVNKVAARKSAALITPSKFVKEDVMNFAHVPAEKFTVTYESSDLIPDNPQPVAALKGKKFIMYLGRPLPHKNLWRLVEAFRLLQKQFPDLYLALAGKKDPLYQQMEARLQKEGIKNVVFTDFISEAELKWLYQNCQVYAFPSLSEGFGLPALEALRHGAPLASTNATCSPEIYGDAALYFDPLDPSDMADKIAQLLTNKKLRQKLIEKGRRQADKYSWARMAQQTLDVYEQVLAEK